MSKKRRQHDAKFKSMVSLEAIKGQKTLAELSSEYRVHSTQIVKWKKQLLEQIPKAFSRKKSVEDRSAKNREDQLLCQIGKLTMELEWVKKNLSCSIEEKRKKIEPENEEISVARQCELLGLNRSSLYYKTKGESEENLHLMNLIDQQYTRYPTYGYPRMTAYLKELGYNVNRKRVARLMREMGLVAIYPKKKLSKKNSDTKYIHIFYVT